MQTTTDLSLYLLIIVLLFSCNAMEKAEKETIAEKSCQKVNDQPDEGKVPDFQMNLWQKGINFYARGHEPSWALDMDFEKQFQFSTMDGFKISVPAVKGDKAMDANVTRYYAEVESGTLIITIQEQKCQDSMADREFDFSVRIQLKMGKLENFKEYKGCGNFVPDFSLHDIWVLEKVNGEGLKIKMTGSELPRFEFFASAGKVLGFAGCNEFEGKYAIVGMGEIQFDDAAMTRKICPYMEIENILSKELFGRRMKYSKQNLNLIFTGFDSSEFIFKKID